MRRRSLYAYRRPDGDPLGYARLLANQGNALAHLGALRQATTKLQEARSIFRAQGEVEASHALTLTLDQIAQSRAAHAEQASA
jgi:ABC-type tungstate transport system substrate-binding protein